MSMPILPPNWETMICSIPGTRFHERVAAVFLATAAYNGRTIYKIGLTGDPGLPVKLTAIADPDRIIGSHVYDEDTDLRTEVSRGGVVYDADLANRRRNRHLHLELKTTTRTRGAFEIVMRPVSLEQIAQNLREAEDRSTHFPSLTDSLAIACARRSTAAAHAYPILARIASTPLMLIAVWGSATSSPSEDNFDDPVPMSLVMIDAQTLFYLYAIGRTSRSESNIENIISLMRHEVMSRSGSEQGDKTGSILPETLLDKVADLNLLSDAPTFCAEEHHFLLQEAIKVSKRAQLFKPKRTYENYILAVAAKAEQENLTA